MSLPGAAVSRAEKRKRPISEASAYWPHKKNHISLPIKKRAIESGEAELSLLPIRRRTIEREASRREHAYDWLARRSGCRKEFYAYFPGNDIWKKVKNFEAQTGMRIMQAYEAPEAYELFENMFNRSYFILKKKLAEHSVSESMLHLQSFTEEMDDDFKLEELVAWPPMDNPCFSGVKAINFEGTNCFIFPLEIVKRMQGF